MATRRSRFQVKPNLKPATKPQGTPTKTEVKKADPIVNKNESPKQVDHHQAKQVIESSTKNETAETSQTSKPDLLANLQHTPKESQVSQSKETQVNEAVSELLEQNAKSSTPNQTTPVDQSKSVSKPTTRFRMIKPKPKLVERTKTSTVEPLNITNTAEHVNNDPKNVLHEQVKDNEATVNNNISDQSEVVQQNQTTSTPLEELCNIDTNVPVVIQRNSDQQHRKSTSTIPEIDDSNNTRLKAPPERRLSLVPKHKEQRQRRPVYRPKFSCDVPPERKKMKMMDLIFWNPITNPMKQTDTQSAAPASEQQEEAAIEEPDQSQVDNGPAVAEIENEVLPGPRLMIGEDGQIVIDETSLVIEQTAPAIDISKQEVVYESSDTTYASFKKPKRSLKPFWTLKETAKFYRALSLVGTDFTLMANIFPERTREDLKKKYKKEERTRQILVDKAMREWHNFDLEDYENFLGFDEIEKILTEAEKVKKSKRKSKSGNGEEGERKKRGPKQKKKNYKSGKNKPGPTEPWGEEEEESDAPTEVLVIDSDQETVDLNNDDDEVSQLKTRTTKRQILIDERKEIQEQMDTERAALEDSVETLPISEQDFQQNDFNMLSTPRYDISPNNVRSPVPFNAVTSPKVRNGIAEMRGIYRLKSPEIGINSPITISHNSTVQSISPTRELNSSNGTQIESNRMSPQGAQFELPPAARIVTPPRASNTPDSGQEMRAGPSSTPKHPTLQAILNEASSALQAQNALGTMTTGHANINLSMGQLVLVTSKTPSNEQVVHVYLVSPSDMNTAQAASNSENRNNNDSGIVILKNDSSPKIDTNNSVIQSVTPGKIVPKTSPSGPLRPYTSAIRMPGSIQPVFQVPNVSQIKEQNVSTTQFSSSQRTYMKSSAQNCINQKMSSSKDSSVFSARPAPTIAKINSTIPAQVDALRTLPSSPDRHLDDIAIFPKQSPSGLAMHTISLPPVFEGKSIKINSPTIKSNIIKQDTATTLSSTTDLSQLGIVRLQSPDRN